MKQLIKSRLYKILGAKIKQKRMEANMSQTDLAGKLKLSRTSIVNIEQGKQQTSLHLLWQIAECMNINMLDLIPSNEELSAEKSFKIEKDAKTAKIEAFLDLQKDEYKDKLAGFIEKIIEFNEKKKP